MVAVMEENPRVDEKPGHESVKETRVGSLELRVFQGEINWSGLIGHDWQPVTAQHKSKPFISPVS